MDPHSVWMCSASITESAVAVAKVVANTSGPSERWTVSEMWAGAVCGAVVAIDKAIDPVEIE